MGAILWFMTVDETGALHTDMSDFDTLKTVIETAFAERDRLTPGPRPPEVTDAVADAVDAALDRLGRGELRIAHKHDGRWRVNEWLKKAVLLSFRLNPMTAMSGGPDGGQWWDKVASKFAGWDEAAFKAAGFRAVPGSLVRRSAYIAPGVVLMPSFVNLGAYVGAGTMVDSWVTVGSCAQIGKNCHLSGGVLIGGVLEPLQAKPVIIEDYCFIGAGSQIAEGVLIGEGAVIAMGVLLSASTKIVDRDTGEVFTGAVPPYSVVVPGSMAGKALPDGAAGPSLYCAVIVKRIDARTRAKTSINALLRD